MVDMKEQIYENIKNCNAVLVPWVTAKRWNLGITRIAFHKYCGELVKEGRLRTYKYSGIIVYELNF